MILLLILKNQFILCLDLKDIRSFCPIVYLHSDRLNRIHDTKYLGCLLSEDQSDDEDMAKQLRTLYIRSNKLLRMFSYCTIDVKMKVIVNHCIVAPCGLVIENLHINN